MAKRPSKSRKSASASATSPDGETVLRIKSSGNMKKAAAKQSRTKSGKKPQTAAKKKAAKIDAKRPKKPPTAFFYFLEDFRKDFQEQNPDVKSMRDIGKACGEKWKIMTYEEKVHYYDIATEKRAEFDRAMAEYTERKESGEDEESEDDSEFDE